MKHLLIFAHSFLDPVVNVTLGDPDVPLYPLVQIPGPVNHRYAEYTELGYDQHTFSATAEHGTAKGFRNNREHYHHICKHVDFDVITDFVMVYHPGVSINDYVYWANKTQAKIWIAVPWNPHPQIHTEYQLPKFPDYNVLPYGAVAYDLLEHGVSPDILFTDEVGHPTPHLSDLCRQYFRYQIMGQKPENPIIISRISEKYSEPLDR